MKKLLFFILIAIASCQSQDKWRQQAKAGLIEDFHNRHKGVIIDSVEVLNVEKINRGSAVYNAAYRIKTTDTSKNGIKISIDFSTSETSEAIFDKNFKVIDK
jgi:hypothetical protein